MRTGQVTPEGERFRFCVSKPRKDPSAGIIRVHGTVVGKNYRQARRMIRACYAGQDIIYIK